MTRYMLLLAACTAMPPALMATTAGGPIGHAAVPAANEIDQNGRNCTRCHTSFPLNSPGGYVRIRAFHYKPGEKQTLQVTVSHPEAQKWGFQLTARMTNDLNRRAGTFGLSTVRVRCSDETNGRDVTAERPCPDDALEFAGHNPNIVFGGENGTKTFEVEWTPPDRDVGNVVFYAVGNAASNSGGNQNDRIFSDNIEIEAQGRPCPNTTRPTIDSIINAASFTRDVSMNTLIAFKGRDFSPSGFRRDVSRADLRSGFPKELGCVAVEIAGQRVPITYVSNSQINAQVPTLATTGGVTARIILNPDRGNQLVSDTAMINLQTFSPAFFTFNSNGKNIAAVHTDGVYATDASVVQGARPVRSGDIVQIFATGLGPTDPVWQAGELPDRIAPLRDRLTLTVGGTTVQPSDILYVGLAPSSISGLYQINLRIPAAVSDGDVPVTMSIGGVTSPAGTVLTVRNAR